MEELRSRRRHFLESFRDTLRRYMEELEVEERRLSAELAAREMSAAPEVGPAKEPAVASGAENGGDDAAAAGVRAVIGTAKEKEAE